MTMQLNPELITPENLQVTNYRPVENDRLEELLNRSKLNWSVESKPLFLNDNIQTDFFGITRTDTNHVFQACSKTYEPLQNREVLELALQISDMTGAEIKVSKALGKGEVMYISLEGRRTKIEGKKVGDTVCEMIQLVNSHDGSKAFGMGFVHVVLSCTNGMTRFDKKGFISIRHTQSMKDKLKSIVKGWKRLQGESDNMIESYGRLMDKNITEDHIKNVLEIVVDVDPNASMDKITTRKKNIMDSFMTSLASEMSYKGRNAWGLLNGVTHFTTKRADNDTKLKSKMFGATAKKDFTVWQYLNQI